MSGGEKLIPERAAPGLGNYVRYSGAENSQLIPRLSLYGAYGAPYSLGDWLFVAR